MRKICERKIIILPIFYEIYRLLITVQELVIANEPQQHIRQA